MLGPTQTPEVTAHDLVRIMELGKPIQIVDVRAPDRVLAGRVDMVPEDRFHNLVGSQLIKLASLEGTGIDPQVPITVVCGKGKDSNVLASHLNNLGCEARSLAGGMAAWMALTVPRELAPPQSLDRLVQFDRVGKGALGYLLVSNGEALVIDPPRLYQPYVEAAESSGATIVAVTDTHVHADYISGARSMAAALGVPYYLHPADSVYPYNGTPGRFDFDPLEDGGDIHFGRCSLTALHTPGHTEGSLTFLIDDQAAFTGDFLFIASIGRPDLAGKVSEWTALLWNSVITAKRVLAPETMIYPAHYGSDLERRGDRAVGVSFGELLAQNEVLQANERDQFTAWVEGSAASFPDAYRKIKAINVGLMVATELEAEELEVGRNECALGGN